MLAGQCTLLDASKAKKNQRFVFEIFGEPAGVKKFVSSKTLILVFEV